MYSKIDFSGHTHFIFAQKSSALAGFCDYRTLFVVVLNNSLEFGYHRENIDRNINRVNYLIGSRGSYL